MFKIKSTVLALVLIASGCRNLTDVGAAGSNIGSALTFYDSCSALEQGYKERYKSQMEEQLNDFLKENPNCVMYKTFEGAQPTAGAPAADAARVEGQDYSGTNNQEQGVDEADFMKTDGNFIYVLNGLSLEILSVPQYGELNYVAKYRISEGSPSALLLFGDRAVVLSQMWMDSDTVSKRFVAGLMPIRWGRQIIKATVLKLSSDRKDAQVEKEVWMDGSLNTARKIANRMFAVSHFSPDVSGVSYWPQIEYEEGDFEKPDVLKQKCETAVKKLIEDNKKAIDAADLTSFVPHVYRKDGDKLKAEPLTDEQCRTFAGVSNAKGKGFTSLLTLDLLQDGVQSQATHIISDYGTVYASLNTLVVAEPLYSWWWGLGSTDEDKTNLHRFSIGAEGVPSYTGSGQVRGTVVNQFAISEYHGDIRVATTSTDPIWVPLEPGQARPSKNHVFVLRGDNKLEIIGELTDLAKGERIFSARFIGDKGYIVTAKNTDPLFTFDLSNPASPKLVGELKAEGVSTYIHPIAGDGLLTVGYGGDQDNINWKTNVSLFSVADFANPSRTSVLSLAPANDRGSWVSSSANYEHKAFTYWEPLKMLAIPLSTSRTIGSGDTYHYEYISKLVLVKAEAGKPLSLYAEFDQSDLFNDNSSSYWYSSDIERSIFMGTDYVYAISNHGVSVFKISDKTRVASVKLKGWQDNVNPQPI